MTGEAIFTRRTLTALVLGVAVLFLLSLVLMSVASKTRTDPMQAVAPNTFSRSAIGQAGFAELLRQLGFPVVQSEYASRSKLGTNGLLIVAEPSLFGQPLNALNDLLQAPNVLLILPKRMGSPDRDRPEWIDTQTVMPAEEATAALRAAVPGGDVERHDSVSPWTTNELGVDPSLQAPVQLLKGPRVIPLVENADGILAGGMVANGRHLWILADPDIIANHGIGQGDNAAFILALIDKIHRAGAPIVFDETIHGFIEQPPGPLTLLFAFPYVLATVEAGLAIALLLWATSVRFGAPEPLAAPFAPGKYGLIENAAELIERGGQQRFLVRRYVETVMHDVAARLHAPRGLSDAALLQWLDRVEKARGADTACSAILQRAVAAEGARSDSATELVPIARDVHRWKGAMLDGAE